MVYRYENEHPITNRNKLDVCRFAERDFLAKSDENEFYVDDTDGIYLCLWKDYDTSDEEYQFVSFEDIVDYPEQNTFNIWGWSEFERRFTEALPDAPRLMLMASGSVYSLRNKDPEGCKPWERREFWQYEFHAQTELDDGRTGYPWPTPWLMREPSNHRSEFPSRLKQVRLFDVEYDFFTRA